MVHAVLATVRVEEPEKARALLEDARVSPVQRAPGFVSALWLEPLEGIGMSVIVFDSEEHARAAMDYPLPPIPGVTPLSLELREVYAHA
ncbi:MAG: hypothetical protein WB565_02575 [Acidimicrobiales bacterium]